MLVITDTRLVTVIAPPWYHLRCKDGKTYPKEVYANDKEYLDDIAQAVRVELDILYTAGVRNLQFDDPNFACEQNNPSTIISQDFSY